MAIDPIDNSVVTLQLTLPNATPTRSTPAHTDPAPGHLPASPAPGWQAPQHEVNVVLDDNRNIVYRFVDQETGEVVQQIPPEETLRMMQSIQELLQKAEPKLKVTG